jgi:hypothetical protein
VIKKKKGKTSLMPGWVINTDEIDIFPELFFFFFVSDGRPKHHRLALRRTFSFVSFFVSHFTKQ